MTPATQELIKQAKDVLELLDRIANGYDWGSIDEYMDDLQAAIEKVETEK